MRFVLFDAPVFLTASVSVAVFYICAQRELYPRTWMKEILLLPPLIALGIGLSLNNARAVLEAIFNRTSAFVRTPKYGIASERAHTARRAAGVAREPVPADALAAAAGRTRLRGVFHVFHLLRRRQRPVFHACLPGAFPTGFLLRGVFVARPVDARPLAFGAQPALPV